MNKENDNFENKIKNIFTEEIEVPYYVKNTIRNTLNNTKENKKKNNLIFNTVKILATVCACCLITTGVVFAKDISNFIMNFFSNNEGNNNGGDNDRGLPNLSNYHGSSIVDALKSVGYDSSFEARKKLYKEAVCYKKFELFDSIHAEDLYLDEPQRFINICVQFLRA